MGAICDRLPNQNSESYLGYCSHFTLHKTYRTRHHFLTQYISETEEQKKSVKWTLDGKVFWMLFHWFFVSTSKSVHNRSKIVSRTLKNLVKNHLNPYILWFNSLKIRLYEIFWNFLRILQRIIFSLKHVFENSLLLDNIISLSYWLSNICHLLLFNFW